MRVYDLCSCLDMNDVPSATVDWCDQRMVSWGFLIYVLALYIMDLKRFW